MTLHQLPCLSALPVSQVVEQMTRRGGGEKSMCVAFEEQNGCIIINGLGQFARSPYMSAHTFKPRDLCF